MSAEFLETVLEHVAHPVFVKDPEFRFVFVNQALCDMVGHTREELLGKTDYEFFPRDEADFFRAKDRAVFEGRVEVHIEQEDITDAAGTRHVLATTKVPMLNRVGEAAYLVGIIHDITQLKIAEDALRAYSQDLEERVAERTAKLAAAQDELVRKERLAILGTLAGGVAHQIRNPLGTIRNATHVLRMALRDHLSPDAEGALRIITAETERANQCVTDLLDYARVRPPVRRPVAVGYLIEQALGGQPPAEKLTVLRNIADLAVMVDPDQVQGALYNLVRNAIEAMPAGGTLTLEAVADDHEVAVRVQDTGPGVAAEVRAKLFEPLVTTKPLGLGLGLSTARGLVETQGGTLRLLPSQEGARFEVRLPRH